MAKKPKAVKTSEQSIALPTSAELTVSKIPGVMTPTELRLDDGVPIDQWGELMSTLSSVRQGTAWWLGDAINYGERTYGEKYAQAIEATEYSQATLENFASVASRVAPDVRRSDLTWSHHEVVAKLSREDQITWLEFASKHGLSSASLRDELKAALKPITSRDEGETRTAESSEGEGEVEASKPQKFREALQKLLSSYPLATYSPKAIDETCSDDTAHAILNQIPGFILYMDRLQDTLQQRFTVSDGGGEIDTDAGDIIEGEAVAVAEGDDEGDDGTELFAPPEEEEELVPA